MTPPCPIAQARLASALIQILIALEADDLSRAAHGIRRFLNHAIAMDTVDLRETASFAALLLAMRDHDPDPEPEPELPCLFPSPDPSPHISPKEPSSPSTSPTRRAVRR